MAKGQAISVPIAGVRWRRVLLFYSLALSGSTILCLGDYLSEGVALTLASFVPVLAALIVTRWYDDSQPSIAFGLRLVPGVVFWWVFAVTIPVVLLFVTVGVDIMLPGVEYTPNFELVLSRISAGMGPEQVAEMKEQINNSTVHPFVSVLGTAMVLGPTVNGFTAFGQEGAWRGWLLRELSPMGYWRASLLVGLMSGLWHAPAILKGWHYPGNPTIQAYPILGVVLVTSLCTAESPLAVLIQWQTHSILATSIFRGISNAVGGLDHFLLNISGGDAGVDLEAWVGPTGVAGLIVSLLIAICIRLVCLIRGTPVLPSVLDVWFHVNCDDSGREKEQ